MKDGLREIMSMIGFIGANHAPVFPLILPTYYDEQLRVSHTTLRPWPASNRVGISLV
jgi:hypothetical protein